MKSARFERSRKCLRWRDILELRALFCGCVNSNGILCNQEHPPPSPLENQQGFLCSLPPSETTKELCGCVNSNGILCNQEHPPPPPPPPPPPYNQRGFLCSLPPYETTEELCVPFHLQQQQEVFVFLATFRSNRRSLCSCLFVFFCLFIFLFLFLFFCFLLWPLDLFRIG